MSSETMRSIIRGSACTPTRLSGRSRVHRDPFLLGQGPDGLYHPGRVVSEIEPFVMRLLPDEPPGARVLTIQARS